MIDTATIDPLRDAGKAAVLRIVTCEACHGIPNLPGSDGDDVGCPRCGDRGFRLVAEAK
jgi:hypothetical protein